MWARAAVAAINLIGTVIVAPLDKVDVHVVAAMTFWAQAITPLKPVALAENIVIFGSTPNQQQRLRANGVSYAAVYEGIEPHNFENFAGLKGFGGYEKGPWFGSIRTDALRRREFPIDLNRHVARGRISDIFPKRLNGETRNVQASVTSHTAPAGALRLSFRRQFLTEILDYNKSTLGYFKGLSTGTYQSISRAPKKDRGKCKDHGKNGNNGIGIGIYKRPEATGEPNLKEQEVGQTFLLMLAGCIAGYFVYAAMKRWGEGDSRNQNKGRDK